MFSFNKNKDSNNFRDSMDIENDYSFVNILNENEPSLSLKIQPLHDTIGVSAEKKTTEFCATVTAKDLPEDDSKRAPVDIIVALDISGSMNGSKLDLCKSTLNLLMRELSSSDRFGLVAFGSEAKVVIPVKDLTPENRDAALMKIKNLQIAGCTNMSGGIGLAAQEIKSISSPHEVRTMFLLTDGQANAGISDTDGIVNLAKGCLGDEECPVPIHCFGYGSDHNRELLRDISMVNAGGTYYYVSNDDDVSSAFGDALGGVLSVVAQNTNLTLKVPAEAANLGAQIISVRYDDVIKNADGSYSVDLKDFYAEESRDVIFEVSLSEVYNNEPVPHVVTSMTYLDTLNSKLIQSEEMFGSICRPEGDEISPSNHHVFLQCIRIQTTDIISESQKLADQGNFEPARVKIRSYLEFLQKQNSVKQSSFLDQLLSELIAIKSGLTSQMEYKSKGSFAMQSHWMSHKRQRCNESSNITPNFYRSSNKILLSNKMKNKMKAGTMDK